MINAGILGMGRWGRLLVESVQGKSSQIRFTAGATRTPSKARAFAKENGIKICTDYTELLARPNVDMVVIATPHSQHFDQIMEAACAGKHVFCEKPFTLEPGETDTALQSLADAGLKAGVGFNRRFAPNTIELKRLLDAGELGDTVHIEGVFANELSHYVDAWRASTSESPAGGMTSLGLHCADQFLHLFGPIARLTAISKRIAMPFDVHDTTTMLVNFEGGQTGYLGTFTSSPLMYRVRVFGTLGWAELYDQDRLVVQMKEASPDSRTWDGFGYPALATVGAGLEAFANSIEQNGPAPISAEDIRHGIEVLAAIVKSSNTNTMVKVG